MTTETLLTSNQRELRNMLTNVAKEPWAWPGGYEKFLILADGACLCWECCKSQGSNVMWDIRNKCNTGWLPAAIDAACNDGPIQCAHCSKEIVPDHNES